MAAMVAFSRSTSSLMLIVGLVRGVLMIPLQFVDRFPEIRRHAQINLRHSQPIKSVCLRPCACVFNRLGVCRDDLLLPVLVSNLHAIQNGFGVHNGKLSNRLLYRNHYFKESLRGLPRCFPLRHGAQPLRLAAAIFALLRLLPSLLITSRIVDCVTMRIRITNGLKIATANSPLDNIQRFAIVLLSVRQEPTKPKDRTP